MKNKNMQPKYKASNASMGRGKQSTLTSPSLAKLSLSELGKVSAAGVPQPRPN